MGRAFERQEELDGSAMDCADVSGMVGSAKMSGLLLSLFCYW